MFALLESVRNLLRNRHYITKRTLRMWLHCLGKLKIKIFSIYLAYMEANTNKF